MLHQIKAPQFNTDLGLQKHSWIPLLIVKFKYFLKPLSVFQVLFKSNLIFKDFSRQSCFKPVQTLFIHALCMQVEKPLPEPLMLDYTNNTKISHSRSIWQKSSFLKTIIFQGSRGGTFFQGGSNFFQGGGGGPIAYSL